MTPPPAALAEREIVDVLRMMPPERVALIAEFIAQVAAVYDPDTIQTFVAWRANPKIDSLLLIASRMDDDMLDQLLFVAEDISVTE